MDVGEEKLLPSLFPKSLQEKCIEYLSDYLLQCGEQVEKRAERDLSFHLSAEGIENSPAASYYPRHEFRRRSSFLMDISDYLDTTFLAPRSVANGSTEKDLSSCHYFNASVVKCQSHLKNFIASHILDKLMSDLLQKYDLKLGSLFCLKVLLIDRLNKLNLSMKGEDFKHPNWRDFLNKPQGTDFLLQGLSRLYSLSTLIIHSVCNNEMLYILSDSCPRLQVLDISYSYQVSDLGLVYLCGSSKYEMPLLKSSGGCKFLRELHFYPQCKREDQGKAKTIMPRVLAFLLKHLPFLEVADFEGLNQGIDFYLNGGQGIYRPKHDRISPLKLIHYTGTDRMENILKICPKLRTFKIFVTDNLAKLGEVLRNHNNSIHRITLVFGDTFVKLNGLEEFLVQCGKRISSFQIETEEVAEVTLKDLKTIAKECVFLEHLCFTSLKMNPDYESMPIPFVPLKMPFLRELKLSNIQVEKFSKEVFKLLLGGCPEIESLFLSFKEPAYYFSDFLLDDILLFNPLGRIEQFFGHKISLTLISALRLISSRPKLRHLGNILSWDVEQSELVTFAQILRRAKSLNLLQEISII